MGIQEDFFQWCLERAEGFDRDGVFYQKYHTNGAKAGDQFQPDQTGTLLWAVWHHYTYQKRTEDATEFKDLIEKAANGICMEQESFCCANIRPMGGAEHVPRARG